MTDIPIVLVSFNRPHYLSEVLDSLAAQTALAGKQIYLFQDGGVSPYTGIRYGEDADIAACVDLFRAKIPNGIVMQAPHNLGIGANFLRAETFVFKELGADVAYFFEDDMVLSPHYFTMMDQIWGHVRNAERVGYFAAYGKHQLPLEKQQALAHQMTRMALHWGFGLTRRHWVELREWLQPYYDFVSGRDYRQRPTQQIVEHYRGRGIPLVAINQDILKKTGTYMLGRVQLMTFACYGKYIGAEGVHFEAQSFADKKYEHTVLYPEPVDLVFPTADELEDFHRVEMADRWKRLDAAIKARDEKRARNEERRRAKRAESRANKRAEEDEPGER